MDTLILSEFTGDSPDLGWYIQNDNVMGGQSQGRFQVASDELIFQEIPIQMAVGLAQFARILFSSTCLIALV